MKKCTKPSIPGHEATCLYEQLTSQPEYAGRNFWPENHCDGMIVLYESIRDYWKPRFLIDHKNRRAFEFMDRNEQLLTVTRDDILWETLRGVPAEIIARAEALSAHFPSRIGPFRGGRAEVCWQLNPDGRYYMDEAGYGMSDDEEINIYGVIDRCGHVVVKFRAIGTPRARISAPNPQQPAAVPSGCGERSGCEPDCRNVRRTDEKREDEQTKNRK